MPLIVQWFIKTMQKDPSNSTLMCTVPLCCAGSMLHPKIFICPNAAALQTWMKHMKDRRHKSRTQPLSPSQCALSYLVMTIELSPSYHKCEMSVRWHINTKLTLYVASAAALRWALEKRGAEEILAARSYMGVGGFAYTTHGPARIRLGGPYHQHTPTGIIIIWPVMWGQTADLDELNSMIAALLRSTAILSVMMI